MPKIPLSKMAYERSFSGAPTIHLLNRFFEAVPAIQVNQDGAAVIARSGSKILATFPTDGILRGAFSSEGLFNGDLFVVIGEQLYRLDKDGNKTPVLGGVGKDGFVSFAFQAGADYERIFIADGDNLKYYEGIGAAKATLNADVNSTIGNTHVISIGGVYYSWSATVTANATGTALDPFLAKLGADNTASLANMVKLLNASGTAGTDYSANISDPSTIVTAKSSDTKTLKIVSKDKTSAANNIALTSSGTGLSWSNINMEGGGTHILTTMDVPDDKAVASVASLASYIVLAISDSDRFYWVNPAETTIDALNFATAEQQPDNINQVVSVGDNIWLIGDSSLEVWAATGDTTAPFAPISGRVYSRGAMKGTAVVVKDTVILVGNDGIVYQVGGSVNRVSHNGIEQLVRECKDKEL